MLSLLAFTGGAPAWAQTPTRPQTAPPVQVVPVPAVPSPAAQMPSIEELIYLIRNLSTAINHANITDNYTELMGLSGKEFQKSSSIDNLRTQFASMRARSVDFSVTLAIAPQFSTAPVIDPTGMLRLTGYFPTQPRITYDFGFRMFEGRWVPIGYGIGVITDPPPLPGEAKAAAPPAAEPPAKRPSAPKKQ